MVQLYDRQYTRDYLMRHVGSVSQLGGARQAELSDGRGRGVRLVDLNLGDGFELTVVPDRGMDVYAARYQGMSLAWHSSVGVVAPSYYEPEGTGWLRSFGGGLLATCGLSYAGAATVDYGGELGLHGRIGNLPASGVQAGGHWEGDEYVISTSGEVRETVVFGTNLVLDRKIWGRLGERRFFLEDRVRNESFHRVPHQILYHINLGFPLVDAGARVLTPSARVVPRDAEARRDSNEWAYVINPTPEFAEKVYYHDMKTDADGYVLAGLVNFTLWQGEPFGLYVKYLKEQLPRFAQWKMMGEGDYVMGLEPANCGVEGRNRDRADGLLQFLEPGEERQYQLEIGLIKGDDEYREFRARLE